MYLSVPDNSNKPPLKDRIIPWYFVMAFLVVFAVNGVFVYIALHTHTGVITEHAYEKGLNYDAILAQAKQQATLGWKDILSYENGQLHYQLYDKSGKIITNAKITAYISRPLQSGYGQKIGLSYSPDTHYTAPIHFPLNGQWDITVIAQWKHQQHQAHKRIVVR